MTKYNKNSIYYKRMCERVGQDFEKWLRTKYWDEKLNSRDIAEIVYDKRKNGPNITVWMKKLGIPARDRSSAVALQWNDNPTRRKAQRQYMKKVWAEDTDGSLRAKIIEKMQTKEYKTKISRANSGEQNGMWNPDLSDEERVRQRYHARRYPGYQDFRKKVYERDEYTCVKCGDDTGGNLVVHHLNGFHWDEESRTEVDNGATLCNECHKEFHSTYGNRHNDLFQFAQFMDLTLTK